MLAPPRPPTLEETEALIREARARQRRRQLIGAGLIAVAAASALAIGAGLQVNNPTNTRSRTGRPASASALPSCRSDQLRLTAPKGWGAAAGSLIAGFTLTNTSGSSCAVAGWPAVQRLSRAGQPIPVTVQRWVYTQRGPAPYRVVRLRPGGAATFPVTGQDWNHAVDRACPNAGAVRVEPTGGGGWLSVALKIPACRRWNVGPFVRGRQAPWPTFALSDFNLETGRT